MQGRRHDFTRHEVFRALQSGRHLADAAAAAAWVCEVDAEGWDRPLELHGLPILARALPVQPYAVPRFGGTIILKKENVDGSNAI